MIQKFDFVLAVFFLIISCEQKSKIKKRYKKIANRGTENSNQILKRLKVYSLNQRSEIYNDYYNEPHTFWIQIKFCFWNREKYCLE